ncbi:MAG: A/G-specific adenine glycosylase [Oscillospiraceae bacterium]|nr:A/G-specific adenine glycosylase [Oscillospiraceae bacterium]
MEQNNTLIYGGSNAAPLERLPEKLLPWFRANARALPWRTDREPYHVWLSEIMLQQTRVEAVKGYYNRFLEALPDIASLAAADGERLAKLWEGLGYYSRMRNLQAAARSIMSEHGGVFPAEYAAIRALPGVGDYTAGAVASICFGLPEPAVDGNVLRVLSRLTGDERPVNEERTKAAAREALRGVYPAGACGEFTQALMELGAVVCLPNGAPDCAACPLQNLCRSRDGAWKRLPVRGTKKARQQEQLTVFLLLADGAAALKKRPASGLLAGLWEFPNVPGALTPQEAAEQAALWGAAPRDLVYASGAKHIFTHVEWEMRCYCFLCAARAEGFVWAGAAELDRDYALPTAFRKLWTPAKEIILDGY